MSAKFFYHVEVRNAWEYHYGTRVYADLDAALADVRACVAAGDTAYIWQATSQYPEDLEYLEEKCIPMKR